MPSVLTTEPKYPSLSKADRATIIGNLEESIAVLNRNERLLSVSEIQIKSMLTTLWFEIKNAN